MYTKDNIVGARFSAGLNGSSKYILHRKVNSSHIMLRAIETPEKDYTDYDIDTALSHLNKKRWIVIQSPLESYEIF